MASPVPVLPEVGSMSVPPARRRPSRSAASISRMATRSLIEPPGLNDSSLATIRGFRPAPIRARRTRGVLPTVSRIDSLMSAIGRTMAGAPGGADRARSATRRGAAALRAARGRCGRRSTRSARTTHRQPGYGRPMVTRLSLVLASVLALCALQAPMASAAGPWSLFDSSTTIADTAADDAGTVEVGVKFSVAAATGGDYWVDAVRFYRPSHGMVSNTVSVFDAAGNLVGHGNATYEGPYTGMVDVSLQSPVKLTPGATYTAGYTADGYYVEQQHGFDAPRTVGPITFPTAAGVYSYGGDFPTDSWE